MSKEIEATIIPRGKQEEGTVEIAPLTFKQMQQLQTLRRGQRQKNPEPETKVFDSEGKPMPRRHRVFAVAQKKDNLLSKVVRGRFLLEPKKLLPRTGSKTRKALHQGKLRSFVPDVEPSRDLPKTTYVLKDSEFGDALTRVSSEMADQFTVYLDEHGIGISMDDLIRLRREQNLSRGDMREKFQRQVFDYRVYVPFVAPYVPKFNASAIIQAVRNNPYNIRMLPKESHVLIPKLEALTKDQMPPMVAKFWDVIAPIMPNFDSRAEVRFFPTYRVVKMLEEGLVMYTKVCMSMKPPRKDKLIAFTALANSVYCGNGDYLGQIGRLGAVQEVTTRTLNWGARWKDGKSSTLAINIFSFLLCPNGRKYNYRLFEFQQYILPPTLHYLRELVRQEKAGEIAPLTLSGGIRKALATNSDEVMKGVAIPNLGSILGVVKVNPKADAGPLWFNRKREDVFIQDFYISVQIWNAWKSDKSKHHTTFWKEWDWVRVAYMKPKVEVYLRSQFSEKVRNYLCMSPCGVNFFQVIFALMSKNLERASEYFYREKFPDMKTFRAEAIAGKISANLIGETFWKGNFWVVINSAMVKKVMVMSDNVYLVVKDQHNSEWWLSLDGEKMEGSVSPELAVLAARFALSMFMEVEPTWTSLMLSYFPRLATDIIATLSTVQFVFPGQASGNTATIWLNHLLACLWVYEHQEFLKTNGVKQPLKVATNSDGSYHFTLQGLEQANKKSGVSMKIERGTSVAHILNPPEEVTKPIDLDFLGFSAVSLAIFGIEGLAPVLQEERLLKGILFFKNDPVDKVGLTMEQKNLIRLLRLRALYMTGGWAYPEVGLTIQLLARDLLAYLPQKLDPLNAEEASEALMDMAMTLGLSENQANSFVESTAGTELYTREVPTYFELIIFLTGNRELATDWVQDFMDKHPEYDVWRLMPRKTVNIPVVATSLSIRGPPRNEMNSKASPQDLTVKPEANVFKVKTVSDYDVNEKRPVSQLIWDLMPMAMRDFYNYAFSEYILPELLESGEFDLRVTPLPFVTLAKMSDELGVNLMGLNSIFNGYISKTKIPWHREKEREFLDFVVQMYNQDEVQEALKEALIESQDDPNWAKIILTRTKDDSLAINHQAALFKNPKLAALFEIDVTRNLVRLAPTPEGKLVTNPLGFRMLKKHH